MPKVLISDKMSPLAAKCFETRGIKVAVKPGMSPEELIACIGEYDGLAVRSTTKVTAEVFEAAESLKVVGRAGIRHAGQPKKEGSRGHRALFGCLRISPQAMN